MKDKSIKKITKKLSLNILKKMTKEISECTSIWEEEQFNKTVVEVSDIAVSAAKYLEELYTERKVNLSYEISAEIFQTLMPSWKEIRNLRQLDITSKIIKTGRRAVNTTIAFDMSWKKSKDNNSDY